MKISEIITDRYKLRIPPTVYYDLLADVVEVEEEQEPKIVPIAEIKYDEDKLKELVDKAVLTVTPQEPKTGEWIKQNDDYYDWYECSECGYGSEGEMQYSSEYDVRTKYCPNCGAKMVEPQEKEDTT